MKWIASIDIAQWANSLDSQSTLPLLVRKLIRATLNNIRDIHFPSGENISLGGWDGILNISEATEYIPDGISFWEFGTNKDVKGKADDDYEKRTSNPLGFNPTEGTYIFVTPRLWTNKEKWIKEKKKDGVWKDIQVVDAEVLEEWIDTAPTVGSWFAKHLGKYPSEGIQPTEDFWEEWRSGTKFNLNENILLGGREALKASLIENTKIPTIAPIQGISREEALAFIVSCFKNSEYEEDFFARSIIIDNPETFRKLATHKKPLILIPRFDNNGIINRAISNGHTVLMPLGVDSSENWENRVKLPNIDRDSFILALEQVGITHKLAEQYSKETARNITILRRKLGFEHTIPEWAHPNNVSDIIPALIVGRWDEYEDGDKEIISILSNDTYENYIYKLSKWLYSSDSPIIKVGSKWRLTSPFDSWTHASKYLSEGNFDQLQTVFLEVLGEIDPAFDLNPEDRSMARVWDKKRKYSSWLREGLTQSLILSSIFSTKLNINFITERWVDRVIQNLLDSNNSNQWKSFDSKLPLIAEASPSSFLSSVEELLKNNKSLLLSLFDEDPGLLTPHSYHTGVLWALEGLAWFPEYLSRSAIILARLAAIDPGGNLSNRPINSLSEIFKPWHYQTLASFDERVEVLKLITAKEPEIGWKLLIKMLPEPHGIAHSTHKTRWRMFEMEDAAKISYSYNEVHKTHSFILEMLLSIVGDSEAKISQLIKAADNLNTNDRDKIFSYIQSRTDSIERTQNLIWHTCREELHHHRSYPDTEWSLSDGELNKYQVLYDIFYPNDEIERGAWMFDEHFPKFHVGHQYKSETYKEYEDYIEHERIRTLTDIYNKYGFGEIIKLIQRVNEAWILGDIFSHVTDLDQEIIDICKLLEKGEKELHFAKSFIYRKSLLNGFNWVTSFYSKLKVANFNDVLLAKYLTSVIPNQELWGFLENTSKETIDAYWEDVFPRFQTPHERIIGVEKLIVYKRFFSAIDIVYLYRKEIPTDLIIHLLKDTATIKAEEKGNFDSYKLNTLFKELDSRSDIKNNDLAQLEWMYISLLASHNNQRKPKYLYKEISSNPSFFIDLVKIAFGSEEEDATEEVNENGLSKEQIQNRATMVFRLLYSWDEIPGCNDGKIDSNHLNEWINKVRELAANCGRIKIVDALIGQVFAHYPRSEDETLVPEDICEIIEKLNSDSLNRNFNSSTHNKQGVTTRGVFDGGDIERNRASYFHELAKKHRNKYPVITTIFENLAKDYEVSAKRMDDEAEINVLDY